MKENEKKICFVMNKEMHGQLKSICAMRHCSMKTYILKAIAEKILKDETGLVKSGS